MSSDFPAGGANPYLPGSTPGRPGPTSTSGKAITSLVLGLLGFVFCCLTGVPAIVFGALGLRDINASNGQVRGSGLAITGIVLGSMFTVASLIMPALLLPAIQAAREAAQRNQASNKLKMVGLALQNYHDVNKTFPAAYSKDDNGQPALSWRVAILPYLEAGALAQQFKAGEAWDSPGNKPLIDQEPDDFLSPKERPAVGETNIVGIVGPDTVLSSEGPKSMRDILDGTSKTVMAVELAGTGITWTEPRDITIDELIEAMHRARSGPGAHPDFNGGVLALCADASVHVIPIDIDPATLRALCTRAGREPVTMPDID